MSTQDQRVAVWESCRVHWKDPDKHPPPTSISSTVLGRLKTIYDVSPEGRSLEWEQALLVDSILMEALKGK